ncbi:MAG: hypothetical protein IH956_09470 [Chloroflexi bacterium]|nr:hypothetical protein [Chloroflexota bacterium]
MISRLRPLDVAISFRERTYRLGEPIDLTVDLTPHRDCDVREGRIDLMVEEQWTERSTVSYEKPIVQTGMRGEVRVIGSTTETRQIVREHKEKYAHSSTAFLEATRLDAGRSEVYRVLLQIQPDPPAHANEAKARWWLQTVIDVAGARDIRARTKVDIAV